MQTHMMEMLKTKQNKIRALKKNDNISTNINSNNSNNTNNNNSYNRKNRRNRNKTLEKFLHQDILENAWPTEPSPNKKTYNINYHVFNVNCKEKAHADLIGQFPYRSSRVNKYIFILYHYGANAVLATPIKNRKVETITIAWKEQNERFKEAGEETNTYVMDNEASKYLKMHSGMWKLNTN